MQLVVVIEALKSRTGEFQEQIEKTSTAVQAAYDAAASLAHHRAMPAIDAKLGAKLTAKLKSESNERGGDLDDLVATWGIAKKVAGWLDREEFFKTAVATLTEVTQKRQKSDAHKGLDKGKPAEEREKLQLMTVEERAKYQSDMRLQQINVRKEDIEACFEEILAKATSSSKQKGSQCDGLIDIRFTVQSLIAAGPERKAKDADLFEACKQLTEVAVMQQQSLQTAIEDLIQKQNEERTASEAQAMDWRKQAERIKEGAAAKKPTAATVKDAQIPGWMKAPQEATPKLPRADSSCDDEAKDANAPSSTQVADAEASSGSLLEKLAVVDGNKYAAPQSAT